MWSRAAEAHASTVVEQVINNPAPKIVDVEAEAKKKADKRARQKAERNSKKQVLQGAAEKGGGVEAKGGDGADVGKRATSGGCGTTDASSSSAAGAVGKVDQLGASVGKRATSGGCGTAGASSSTAVVASSSSAAGADMEIDWGDDDDSGAENGEDGGKIDDDKDDLEVGEGKDSDGKHRLSCDICHEAMGASKLLLLRTDDWCGHLDCRCYQCSLTEESFTGTEREYGKKIRHMWKQRKVETGRVVASHEQAMWKNTTRMYRTRYPGLLGRVYRDLALHHLRTFALVMAADLMKDEATKKAAEAVQDEHLRQITAMAADPTYVVPHQGWTLSAREASYLFRVTAHIICAACGYYGGDWIESAISYHFRCP